MFYNFYAECELLWVEQESEIRSSSSVWDPSKSKRFISVASWPATKLLNVLYIFLFIINAENSSFLL